MDGHRSSPVSGMSCCLLGLGTLFFGASGSCFLVFAYGGFESYVDTRGYQSIGAILLILAVVCLVGLIRSGTWKA
jgi:hypothetical protein